AHILFFFLLMLAGLNIPISEDIILLTGGAIASTCIPDHTLRLYLWLYFGSWISAWEVYWLGRLLGPKLYNIKSLARFVTPKRVEKLHHYYEKFGVFVFMLGRFIPGGVRNALFISCGMGKMPFLKFILRDGFACIFSSLALFSLGYWFGSNHEVLVKYAKTYNYIVIGLILLLIVTYLGYLWLRNREKIDKTTSQ
ncbi:MAG: DedA family protein, partial [Chlamydiota bacterium]